jgi:hypothetical protein
MLTALNAVMSDFSVNRQITPDKYGKEVFPRSMTTAPFQPVLRRRDRFSPRP